MRGRGGVIHEMMAAFFGRRLAATLGGPPVVFARRCPCVVLLAKLGRPF